MLLTNSITVAMPQVLCWLQLLALSLVATSLVTALPPAAGASSSSLVSLAATRLPPCSNNTKCGNVSIPYPFGIGDNCYWQGMDDGFKVTCNNSFDPPRPYVFGNLEISKIMVETSEIRVFADVASSCYNSSNTTEAGRSLETWLNTTDTPFLISPTQNVFTGIGCYTQAILNGREDWSYTSGCVTTCMSLESAAKDGDKCTGLGCCQTSIPGNLSFITVSWGENGPNPAWNYSPCSYAFVVERNSYTFSRKDLSGKGNDSFVKRVAERGVPVVLDWAIRNGGSCQPGASGAPACVSNNSYCENATYGGGYLCKCSKGYQGNPYAYNSKAGCIDINECSTMDHPCGPYTTCQNTDGGHICKCKFNHKGDGKSKEGCNQYKVSPYVIASIAIIVAIILACFAVILLQKRNQRKLFNKNGGKILAANGIAMYSERDLKKITRGRKRLGGGNFGEVYEGRIDGAQAQRVAVKYSVVSSVQRRWPKMIQQVVHEQEQEDDGGIVSEIIFQFKIKHTNVVKLIGCCLETDVPILVYEFISNGSLHDRLHGGDKRYTLSLMNRLDIAIGSAEALSHIHSHGDHVHGDVKPENILLDDDLNPKVSDFGSSKLLSFHSYYKGIVPADLRYIDPVYMKTNQFTVKSDVYSFGVVLLELITRKTAMYDGNRSLPLDFKFCKDEGSRRKMYDSEVCSGDDPQSQCNMQCLDMIGTLAVRCLKEDLEERPTMAEVVEELKQVKAIYEG